MDLYSILEVSREASDEEIKRAYRKLALKHHPDKVSSKTNSPEDVERFQKISHAYSILSDTRKRRIYDLTGEEAVDQTGPSFSEIIEIQRVDSSLELTYQELIQGCTKIVELIEELHLNLAGLPVSPQHCPGCGGQGPILKMMGMLCRVCQGVGISYPLDCIKATKTQSLKVEVLPKSWPGRVFEVDGKKIQVRPKPSETIVNQGIALIYIYKLSVFEALLGLETQLKLYGEEHPINYPVPIEPNTTIIIKEAGLYGPNGERGPLAIKFDIEYPKSLSAEQRKLIQQCIP